MSCPTILIVDDDPDQAELLAEVLSAAGRRVLAYADPMRALAALAEEDIDLLIADLSMPWVDGERLISSARARRPDMRIFLISGYARGADIAAKGGVRFFAKPFDFRELRRAVSEALGESSPAD